MSTVDHPTTARDAHGLDGTSRVPSRRGRVILLAWGSLAVLFAVHNMLTLAIYAPKDVRHVLWIWVLCSAVWAGLTPLILMISRALPLRGERWIARGALHLLAAGLISMTSIGLYAMLRRLVLGLTSSPGLFESDFHVGVWIYAAIVAVDQASRWEQEAMAKQLRASQLEATLAQTRLEVLRNRLQPHFLFNALNSVSVLMFDDVEAAHRMLLQVGELLRLSINVHQQREIPLEDELQAAELYLGIERIRLADRLDVRIDVPPGMLDVLVPPFLLQPLVENAIRHGIERNVAGGMIAITARDDKGRAVLEVRDDGNGASPAREGSGVGLSTTASRLEALYGTDQSIASDRTAEGWRVMVTIPLVHAEVQSA